MQLQISDFRFEFVIKNNKLNYWIHTIQKWQSKKLNKINRRSIQNIKCYLLQYDYFQKNIINIKLFIILFKIFRFLNYCCPSLLCVIQAFRQISEGAGLGWGKNFQLKNTKNHASGACPPGWGCSGPLLGPVRQAPPSLPAGRSGEGAGLGMGEQELILSLPPFIFCSHF